MKQTLFMAIVIILCLFSSSLSRGQEEKPGAADPEERSHEVASLSSFNPHEGLGKDGRIPRPELPEGIKNPERWRYVPEGRIKPGTILQRFTVSNFIIPSVFYEQDIGAGAGILLFDSDFRQQRRREFAGTGFTYTTEGQKAVGIGWRRYLNHRELENGGVILEERSMVQAGVGYSRTLTRRFFGIGPDTTADNETSYTDEASGFIVSLQKTLPDPGDDLLFSLGLTGYRHNLSPGRVSDRPTTDAAFPGLFNAADSFDILWVNGMLRYDTRDSQHTPYKGWMIEASVDGAPTKTGRGTAAIYKVSGNMVKNVPGLFHDGGDANEEHPPTDVLALGGHVHWTEGDLPFWALPTLGGSQTLRGYIANRFTDRALWHVSAEYRFWVFPRGFSLNDSIRAERLGLALFYDAGTVAPALHALTSAETYISYGLSFRFTLERMALFRADVGFSSEGTNLVVGFGNSF